MNIFSSNWILPKAKMIIAGLVFLTAIAAIGYFVTDQSGNLGKLLGPLFGALFIGLLLMSIQFLFSWQEHIERENLRLLGLNNVLGHKRDPEYYGKLIREAKTRIYLMGRTARHFLEDFANEHGGRNEARYLLEALGRNVEVRFLLPHESHLPDDSQKDAKSSAQTLAELDRKFENFSYKYFNHHAIHSIFVADNNVIIGPYFPDLASMDTPALHLKSSANLPKKYLEYFEKEWNQCLDPN